MKAIVWVAGLVVAAATGCGDGGADVRLTATFIVTIDHPVPGTPLTSLADSVITMDVAIPVGQVMHLYGHPRTGTICNTTAITASTRPAVSGDHADLAQQELFPSDATWAITVEQCDSDVPGYPSTFGAAASTANGIQSTLDCSLPAANEVPNGGQPVIASLTSTDCTATFQTADGGVTGAQPRVAIDTHGATID